MDHTKRKIVFGLALSVITLAFALWLLRSYLPQIKDAASAVSWWQLSLAAALGAISIALRSEMWTVCLHSMSAQDRIPRASTHLTNGIGTFASLLHPYLSLPVRVSLLRRLEPKMAPRAISLIGSDAPVLVLEVCLTAILLVVSTSILQLGWWVPVLAGAAGVSLLVVAHLLRARWGEHVLVKAIAALHDHKRTLQLLGLLGLGYALQVLRIMVVYKAVGLEVNVQQAIALFVAAGVLGTLPVGGPSSMVAASVLLFGSQSVGLAAAAGLVLTVAAALGIIVYVLLTTAWWRKTLPRRTALSYKQESHV